LAALEMQRKREADSHAAAARHEKKRAVHAGIDRRK
jgi:hypothetical protein